MSYIALIAGQGVMPLRLIEEIHAQGNKVLLLGIKGVTPPSLIPYVDRHHWAKITQLGKARKLCLKYNAKQAVMAGLIRHNNIFSLSLFSMDWTTLRGLLSLRDLRADSICLKVIELFQEKGIEFMSTVQLLRKFLAPRGLLTLNKPSKKVKEDIDFGIQIAKELGRMDIGQTVVIKNKSIVALEAMEGTDKCLQRAGEIAGEGCIVVKLPKPNQDARFDVPVIGINTIEKLAKIKAAALAIAAEKTIVIDPEVQQLADSFGLIILSVEI